MAWFECDHGKRYAIFGDGGGIREAKRLKVPLIGQIPLDILTREHGDAGTPIASASPDKSKVINIYHEISKKITTLANA